MKHPSVEVTKAIVEIMGAGSAKDGADETWRTKDVMYHLSKAQSHLSVHIKQKYDPRSIDGEDHLKLAITRLGMALCVELDSE